MSLKQIEVNQIQLKNSNAFDEQKGLKVGTSEMMARFFLIARKFDDANSDEIETCLRTRVQSARLLIELLKSIILSRRFRTDAAAKVTYRVRKLGGMQKEIIRWGQMRQR